MSGEKEMLYKTSFKQWCVENHMPAATIAKELECSVKTVYAYMQGYRYPSRKMLRAMEEKLGIDTRRMFD